MEKFHNPYHFVPVRHDDSKRDKWTTVEEFKSNAMGHPSHARYDTGNGIYHGRITCTLTTEGPTFIGAKREEGSEQTPGTATPFELEGRPAIPASSLRGMISSIAEAASNSAMRVLEDKMLSRRKEPTEALSALGLVKITTNADGKIIHRIYPLAAPVLETDCVPVHQQPKEALFHLPDRFRTYFNGLALYPKICFGDIQTATDSNGKPLKTYSLRNPQRYYLNCTTFRAKDLKPGNKALKTFSQTLNNERGRCKKHFLLHHNCHHYQIVREEDVKDKTKGILGIIRFFPFSFGKKRRHYFFPFEKKIDDIPGDQWKTIPQNVVDKFKTLSDQRTEAEKGGSLLPNIPQGAQRNLSKDPNNRLIELKTGDIVFFDVNKDGTEISEISFSAIWRDKAGGSVFDYFSPEVQGQKPEDNTGRVPDKEMLPFHSGRTKISPAEMVFGFVQDQKKNGDRTNSAQEKALAYAGRVRFSHGIFKPRTGSEDVAPYLPEVTLKILDAPKPPSPALYFTNGDGAPSHIAKSDLELGSHVPQGRKFYLHHRQKAIEDQCWKTHYDEAYFANHFEEDREKKGRFKQKVRITPMRGNLAFEFHIDFENLKAFELGMLCYALRPTKSFRHKIGMGKPLGLGKVFIDVTGIEFINRKQRYAEDVFIADHYHTDEVIKELDCAPDQAVPYFKDLFQGRMAQIHGDVINALETVGDPANTEAPVSYPQVNQPDGRPLGPGEDELEHFRWWVANSKIRDKEFLSPISVLNRLTTLTKHGYKK